MKQMKIIKRLAAGIVGSIALTSFILSALDAYLARQAASNQATQQYADAAGQDDPEEHLSIGSSERHMLYQPSSSQSDQTGNSLSQGDANASGSSQASGDTNASDNQLQANSLKPSGSNPQPKAETQADKQNSSDSTKQADKQSSSDSTKQADRQKNTEKQTSKKNSTDTKKQTDKKENADTKKQTDKPSSKNGHASDKKTLSFQTVTEDYFSDALFIGDSRTIGMQQSQLLPASCYYAKTGIGIGDILSERIVNEGGYMTSVADALSRHSFGKVYIMIGINDISRGDVDWFLEQYQKILDTVTRTQPNAIVYIQANIPMSYGKQDLNGTLNNRNLALRNEASSTLADSKTVFYLDISQVYADAYGNLASLYTRDGLHVKPDHYALWVDYLLHHAIVCD